MYVKKKMSNSLPKGYKTLLGNMNGRLPKNSSLLETVSVHHVYRR
jgi:hypothetical protein